MMRPDSDRRRRRHSMGVILAMVVCAVIAWAGSAELQGPRQLTLEVTETAGIVASRTTVGFADSDLYFMTPEDVNKTLDMMQSVGVNNVRIMIPWAGVEPTKGVYNWTAVDTVVNAAHARGMGVLGLVNSTPQWAARPGTPAIVGPPASPAVYADFAKRVATRYRGKIGAYEVWNEPNTKYYWSTGPNAAEYTQLLKAAYPAIKAGDPNALVIGGVVAPTKNTTTTKTAVSFLQGIYAAGGKNYFDAISFHPYGYVTKPGGLPPMFSKGLYTQDDALNQLSRMRNVMVWNGDSKKLIWASEYGMPTNYLTEAQQAAYIKDMLTKWRTISYVGPAFIYTTRDSAINAGTFGVWRPDWSAKPAVAVIMQITGGALRTMALTFAGEPTMTVSESPPLPRLLADALRAGVGGAQAMVNAAVALTMSAVQTMTASVEAVIAGGGTSVLQSVAPMSLSEASVPEGDTLAETQRTTGDSDQSTMSLVQDDTTTDSEPAPAGTSDTDTTAALSTDAEADELDDPQGREDTAAEEADESVGGVDADPAQGTANTPDATNGSGAAGAAGEAGEAGESGEAGEAGDSGEAGESAAG